MSAHIKPILKHKCRNCGRVAKFEVYNTYNSLTGYYCLTCARLVVATLNKNG